MTENIIIIIRNKELESVGHPTGLFYGQRSLIGPQRVRVAPGPPFWRARNKGIVTVPDRGRWKIREKQKKQAAPSASLHTASSSLPTPQKG